MTVSNSSEATNATQFNAFTLENGKLFLRENHYYYREEKPILDSVFVGVIEVPAEFKTESIYAAHFDEARGSFELALPSRAPASRRDNLTDLDQMDAREIVSMEMFNEYKALGKFDVFLRDTEIPPSRDGYKWVLSIGSSASLKGHSKLIHFAGGRMTVEKEDFHGMAINEVLRWPEWGDQANPHMIFTTEHPEAFKRRLAKVQASMSKHWSQHVSDKMNEHMPQKTCYSKAEINEIRTNMGNGLIRNLREGDVESSSLSTPKSRM